MANDMCGDLSRRQALAGTVAAAAVSQLPAITALAAARPALQMGRDQPFDFDWRFRLEADEGLESVGLNDAQWRSIDLPHDWSIEDLGDAHAGPFDAHAEGAGATGYTVGGEGWYRKRFRIDTLPADGRAEIRFDGVYNDSEVWLNGHALGRHVYGYTPFRYDLTPYLIRGADNLLAVRVRNLGKNSRWYSGSGIYRGVTLDLFEGPSRIAADGVWITTRRITDATADIAVETLIEAPAGLTLVTRIKDTTGRIVVEAITPAADKMRQALAITSPRLWSPEAPALYTLESELRRGSITVDRLVTAFGVRIVTFDAGKGMAINGIPLKLRGGCIHHDNGLLGAAAHADAEERKVLLLKQRGFNAIRSSHNPSSRAFRDACDRHGMLLIEEAFDMWHALKNDDDYATQFRAHWPDDLTAMIQAARNNPCVIMWSIGNEIPERSTPEGVELQWKLANHARRLDPTRPVTAAINSFAGHPLVPDAATARPGTAGKADDAASLFLDVVGYNYKLDRYEPDHAAHADRVIYGSESFAKDVFAIWALTEQRSYLIGDFVWTAIDYYGEVGIGGTLRSKSRTSPPMGAMPYPWVKAHCGDLDTTGVQRVQSLARDVVWGFSPIELAVHRPLADGEYEHLSVWAWPDEVQSWSWAGLDGKPMDVLVYARGERVELRLNDTIVGSQAVPDLAQLPMRFSVPYAEGLLEAIVFRGGREIGRKTLRTAGPAAAIRLIPEATSHRARRGSLSYLRVEIVDRDGRVVPDAAHEIRLTCAGPADLVGFGNGSPHSTGSVQSPMASAFEGRALAILKAQGRSGALAVCATAAGLQDGKVRLRFG